MGSGVDVGGVGEGVDEGGFGVEFGVGDPVTRTSGFCSFVFA